MAGEKNEYQLLISADIHYLLHDRLEVLDKFTK